MKKLRMAGIILVAVGVFKGLATANAVDPSGTVALWSLITSMAAAILGAGCLFLTGDLA